MKRKSGKALNDFDNAQNETQSYPGFEVRDQFDAAKYIVDKSLEWYSAESNLEAAKQGIKQDGVYDYLDDYCLDISNEPKSIAPASTTKDDVYIRGISLYNNAISCEFKIPFTDGHFDLDKAEQGKYRTATKADIEIAEDRGQACLYNQGAGSDDLVFSGWSPVDKNSRDYKSFEHIFELMDCYNKGGISAVDKKADTICKDIQSQIDIERQMQAHASNKMNIRESFDMDDSSVKDLSFYK